MLGSFFLVTFFIAAKVMLAFMQLVFLRLAIRSYGYHLVNLLCMLLQPRLKRS